MRLHKVWHKTAQRLPAASLLLLGAVQAQSLPSSPAAVAMLVRDAVDHQMNDMQRQGWAVRYLLHRTDRKEDSLRDLVQTVDGNVARTLARNGVPLTFAQNQAEEDRLRTLASTAGVRSHRMTDQTERYELELIGAMPDAMEYTWVSGQPQLPRVPGTQAVLDFKPRAGFRPASTTQLLLTGIAGRIWIDQETHHLLRIELNVVKDLDLALGLLARVYKGGTVTYEQVPVGDTHDAFSHIEIDVRLRELLVKTVAYHSVLDAANIKLLRTVPSLQEGIALLLAEPPGQPQ